MSSSSGIDLIIVHWCIDYAQKAELQKRRSSDIKCADSEAKKFGFPLWTYACKNISGNLEIPI